MDESLKAQIETHLSYLDGLIRRGCEVRDTLAIDPSSSSAIAATRAWQEDCGVTINQLSGGSKAHWLARSFSEAFLICSADGRAIAGAPPDEIVNRLLGVLEQAVGSLSRMEDGPVASASPETPPPRRFGFVHNPELRPVLEQAYTDGRRALEQGDYDLALLTCCGILEAIVTDALGHKGCPDGRGHAAREDCRLVIRDATRRRGENGAHSGRMRPAAGSRAGVSRSH